MKVSVELDDELLRRAKVLTGVNTTAGAVRKAVEEHVRHTAYERTMEIAGKIDLVDNLQELEELDLESQKKLFEQMGM